MLSNNQQIITQEKFLINMFKKIHNNPFYLEKERAMISLGSFNEKQHCVYKCAFCYVQDGFYSYSRLSVEDIIIFLKKILRNIK